MKILILLGFTEKSDFYGGVCEKPIYREGLPENGGEGGEGASTVCRFKEGLAKKRRGGIFEEGGLIGECTL